MLLNYQSDDNNDAGPATRAHIVLSVILPLCTLTLCIVGARILVKTKLGKLGLDDLLIVISTTIALGITVNTTIGLTAVMVGINSCAVCAFGFGMHVNDFQPQWQLTYGKFMYASVILCNPCLAITKTSMIYFYIRFAPHSRFRTVCNFSIGLLMLLWSTIFLINVFGCRPISGGWDRRPEFPSTCITTPPFYYFSVICNISSDILVILLPIPILLRMQLPARTKLGLVSMFSMGFLITGVSSVALYMVNVAIHSSDITWDGAYTWMWSIMELHFGILTACMPAMMLFARWVRGDKSLARPEGELTIGGGGAGKKVLSVVELHSGNEVVCEEYGLNDVGGISGDERGAGYV